MARSKGLRVAEKRLDVLRKDFENGDVDSKAALLEVIDVLLFLVKGEV